MNALQTNKAKWYQDVASFPGSPRAQMKNQTAFPYCKRREAGRGLGTRLTRMYNSHFHKAGATHTCRPVATRKPGSNDIVCSNWTSWKLGWKTHTKVHIYGIFTLWFTQQWVHYLSFILLFLLSISCTSFEQEICYNVLHLNVFFEHLQPSLQQRYRSYGGFKHN